MIWVRLSATLLIGAVLALAWARYSIETGWRRRAAELCLWIGPDLPFLVAALQFVISRPPASAANPAPATISIVAPAAALHVLLLAGVWRTLRTAVNAPSRNAEVTAGLLILGSIIVWFAAIAWPGVELAQIAQHRAEHVFASAAFLLGALLTLAGFTMMNALLENAGDRFVSRLACSACFWGPSAGRYIWLFG